MSIAHDLTSLMSSISSWHFGSFWCGLS